MEQLSLAALYLKASFHVVAQLRPVEILIIGWPLFVLDVPRYGLTPWATLALELWKGRKSKRAQLAERRRRLFADPPLVTVLVPAYNEEEHLRETVASLKRQDYPNIEIIVVNDASSDGTARVCEALRHEGVRIVHGRRRQGKAFGHNVGVLLARGEHIVVCDGDTQFAPDAITEVILPLMDPKVAGVSGALRLKNPHDSILTRLQALEYLFSIEIGRQFSSHVDILAIISGAFGAFRMDAVRRVWGWEVSPGEDADMTKCLRKLGYKVVFTSKAIAYTDAPVTLRGLVKQRFRWNRSTVLLAIRKHRDQLFSAIFWKGFSWSNFISAWDIVLYNLALGSGGILMLGFTLIFAPQIVVPMFIFTFAVYLTMDITNFVAALILSTQRREIVKLLPLIPITWIYTFGQRVLTLVSVTDEILFRSSYTDSYVPDEVSRAKPRWGERDPFAHLRLALDEGTTGGDGSDADAARTGTAVSVR